MESTEDYIIVLTDDANYLKLKNKGSTDVGKKIMFIEDDIIKEKNKYVRPFIGVVAAVIMLMAILIGQFGIDLIDGSKAYAIVSLDINPSLEFQIDKKEVVRKVRSLNEDGKDLIVDSMIGMKIEDAITLSIKEALNKNYLNNTNNIVLLSDVIMDDDPQDSIIIEKKIFKKVEEDSELENIDIIYVDSDKEDLEKARKSQVSVGKYKVYEIISENNPDVKINDIKEKKVSEIVRENKELTNTKKVKTKKKDNKIEKQKNRDKKEENNQKKMPPKKNIKKQKEDNKKNLGEKRKKLEEKIKKDKMEKVNEKNKFKKETVQDKKNEKIIQKNESKKKNNKKANKENKRIESKKQNNQIKQKSNIQKNQTIQGKNNKQKNQNKNNKTGKEKYNKIRFH